MRWAWVRSTLQPDSKLAYVLEEAAVGDAFQAVVCVYLNMRVWIYLYFFVQSVFCDHDACTTGPQSLPS